MNPAITQQRCVLWRDGEPICEVSAVVEVTDRAGLVGQACEHHAARALDGITGLRITASWDDAAWWRLLALPWNNPTRR